VWITPGRSDKSRRIAQLVELLALVGLGIGAQSTATASPIKHVVVIYEENHSFDNVLGRLCVRTGRCNGARSARLPGHRRVPLRRATDLVPNVDHDARSQETAIDGGKMDGFARLHGCRDARHECLTQFAPRQIPNLARLARAFVISDRTFQTGVAASWASHLEIVAGRLDGFTGDNPDPLLDDGPGWGCDSKKDAPWRAARGGAAIGVPACIPDYNLNPTLYPYGGAYRETPVRPIPTIMDLLDQAGLGWKLYAATRNTGHGYRWSICPSFANCLYTPRNSNLVPRRVVFADVKHGTLPAFSAVLPSPKLSQHNTYSMAQGDNWIGRVVGAIERGPEWSSTAIFITYDDCGCFFDHVAPPPGFGPRLPMVIVSPYAKPHHIDHSTGSLASILAFTERTFGLPALGKKDSAAYDYSHSFDYGQPPLAATPTTHTTISHAQRQRLKTIPHPDLGS